MRTYILQKLYNSNTYNILHCRNVLSNMGICISKSLNRVNFSHCIKGNILGLKKKLHYFVTAELYVKKKLCKCRYIWSKCFFLFYRPIDIFLNFICLLEILIYYSKIANMSFSYEVHTFAYFFLLSDSN